MYVAHCCLRYTGVLLEDFDQIIYAFIFICMINVQLKIVLLYPFFFVLLFGGYLWMR